MGQVIFITGTDTGIGKTVVSTLLTYALTQDGVDLFPIKPVESGCETVNGELEPADARSLWEASGRRFALEDIVFGRFAEPVTPALAAKLNGVELNLENFAERILERATKHQLVVVEGAGGLLSPVAESETLADLAVLCQAGGRERGVPVKTLVVVGSRLGALNHAGLTFEVLQRRGLDLIGYVLNNITAPQEGEGDIALATNRETMRWVAKKYGVSELGELPFRDSSLIDSSDKKLWQQMSDIGAAQGLIQNFKVGAGL